MIDPLITAVIPTYRRPKLLQRAIHSVLSQTYKQIRVCVYDNASGDDTRDVVIGLAQRDSRVAYHCHTQNIGAVGNFNYGIEHVQTPYFSMLSDDDFLMPEFYAHAMEALLEHGEAGFFTCRTFILHETRSTVDTRPNSWRPGPHPGAIDSAIHVLQDYLPINAVVFKSGIRDTIGRLNEFASDYQFMARAAAHHSFVVSDYVGAVFTVHSGSFSSRSVSPGRSSTDNPWLLDLNAYQPNLVLYLLTAMMSLPVANGLEKIRLANACLVTIRRLLVFECVSHAIPAGAWEELRLCLATLENIRLPAGLRGILELSPILGRLGLIGLIRGPLRVISSIRLFWRKRRSRDSYSALQRYSDSLVSK